MALALLRSPCWNMLLDYTAGGYKARCNMLVTGKKRLPKGGGIVKEGQSQGGSLSGPAAIPVHIRFTEVQPGKKGFESAQKRREPTSSSFSGAPRAGAAAPLPPL